MPWITRIFFEDDNLLRQASKGASDIRYPKKREIILAPIQSPEYLWSISVAATGSVRGSVRQAKRHATPHAGRHAGYIFEYPCEMTLIGETAAERDLRQCLVLFNK